DFVACQAQLAVPRSLRDGVQSTMPEPRIPLLERLLQALPGTQKARFHVEHAPVEKLPAHLGRTLEQAEAIRVDQLQRQGFGQLGGTARVLAVDANLQLAAALASHADAAGRPLGQLDLAEHGQRRLLSLDDWLQALTAERAGHTQQMY